MLKTGVVVLVKARIIFFVLLAGVFSQYATAALVERLDGAAYYDTKTDLTWASSALLGSGSAFDDGSSANDGEMSYTSAADWVSQLSIDGVTGWRLPRVAETGKINIYDHQSELARLIYGTLDNIIGVSSPFSWGDLAGPNTNDNFVSNFLWFEDVYTGPIGSSSVLTLDGWLVREPESNWPPSLAWGLLLDQSIQGPATIELNLLSGNTFQSYGYALAVQSGDIGTVPLPAALWLFGSSLLGLTVTAKLRN